MLKRRMLAAVLGCSLFFIAACDSSEERAEKHFQTALELIDAGDFSRATVEFRNVFKLNGQHKEARATFAQMLRDQGDALQAYSQYLRLVEQYPEHADGRRALAELSMETGNWDEVERHGRAAAELLPDDPVVRSIVAALDYRAADARNNAEQMQANFEISQSLLRDEPRLFASHQVALKHLASQDNWGAARHALDAAISAYPENLSFYMMRLRALAEEQDGSAIEAQLRKMLDIFPDNTEIAPMLLGWYLGQNDQASAETLLREQVASNESSVAAKTALVEFLVASRGEDAAREELNRYIAQGGDSAITYRTMRALMDYSAGRQDDALRDLQAALEGAETSPPVNDARVTLAKMLAATGNAVSGRAELEKVLESDGSHVEANKLKAAWLIEDDQTGTAISILRETLGNSPRDPQIMSLLANAHERDGNTDLMAEMLALAVEASGNAPFETRQYARHLANNGKLENARAILQDGLRRQSNNTSLLSMLASVQLKLSDWSGLSQSIKQLAVLPGGDELANDYRARLLAARGQKDELMQFLQGIESETGGVKASVNIIFAHVNRGETKEALEAADRALAKNPDDLTLRFVRGSLLAVMGETDTAAASFETILADNPGAESIWVALYRITLRTGDTAAASDVLDRALVANPDSLNLKWHKAVELENNGQIDDAIALYEAMYEQDSDNVIIANNLASLLVTHRDDAESLERAWVVARRLRDRNIPAFQDTYGWISFRRGELESAISHLEPAAKGLPKDATVQYHLAEAYAASGQIGKAITQYQKVIGMSEQPKVLDRSRAQVETLMALEEAQTDN